MSLALSDNDQIDQETNEPQIGFVKTTAHNYGTYIKTFRFHVFLNGCIILLE